MLINVCLLLAGLILLTWSADRFVAAAAVLARHWGVAPLLVGVLVLGIGTSAPEIAVSISASLRGAGDIALGNAVGSNIANLTMVLGATALLRPLPVLSSSLRGEFPAVLLVGVLMLALVWNGQFSRIEGLGLLGLFVLVLGWLAWRSQRMGAEDPLMREMEEHLNPEMSKRRAGAWLLLGLIGLPLSAHLFVQGASGIALAMGISELVVGLTIVAIGTSLPELAASLASARRGEVEMALGNVLGSNLFNSLIVFGIPGAIAPMAVPEELWQRDLPIMLGVTLLCFVFASTKAGVNRLEGAVLSACFVTYLLILAA